MAKAKSDKGSGERAAGPFRTDVAGLSSCKSWLDDVLVALRTVQHPETGVLSEGAWTLGADFVWVEPMALVAPQVAVAGPARDAPSFGLIAAEVPTQPVTKDKPSDKHGSQVDMPRSERSAGKGEGLDTPRGLFAAAKQCGTVTHKVFELWGYRGEVTDALVGRALTASLPGAAKARAQARVQHLRALVDHACASQPGLVAELREAADRGELLHEVDVRRQLAGEPATLVVGQIDLLYRGGDGAWHVLDYKSDDTDEDGATPKTLDAHIADHYPQVRQYATHVAELLPGGQRVGSFGLWFVRAGAVVRWRCT